MAKKYSNEAKLGLFILLVFAIFAYLTIKIGRLNVGEDIRCKAIFDNAGGIVKDAAVMVAGVRVGTVKDLAVEHNKAVLTLALRSDAKLRKDVKATIRMKSLLGEKYVQLIPQSDTAPLLKSGDVITDTVVPNEIDELVDRLAVITESLARKSPQTAKLIEETVELVALLRKALEKSTNDLPELVRNTRDAALEMKTFAAETRAEIHSAVVDFRKLTASAQKMIEENRSQVRTTLDNARKISSDLSERSDTISKKLNEVLGNLARATEKLPSVVERLDSIAEKLDKTLAMSNVLLEKVNRIDSYTIKKFLQEDGITINLFKKKVTPEGEVKEPVYDLEEE